MEAITSVEYKRKNGHMYVRRDGGDWTEVEYQSPEWFNSPPMTQEEGFEWFKRYAVEAETLRDFCERYHLPGKVWNKEADYQSHKEELLKNGYTLVPRGTSGLVSWAAYYGTL